MWEVDCCWKTEENVSGQEREVEGGELSKGAGANCEGATGAGGSQVSDPRSVSYTWRLR